MIHFFDKIFERRGESTTTTNAGTYSFLTTGTLQVAKSFDSQRSNMKDSQKLRFRKKNTPKESRS